MNSPTPTVADAGAVRCAGCGTLTDRHGYGCGVADAMEAEAAVDRDLYEVLGDEYRYDDEPWGGR